MNATMQHLIHHFFGELDLEKGLDDYNVDETIVLWEKEINGINTTLWYQKNAELSSKTLDTFSTFLNNFENYHQKALQALTDYLTEDNEYIVFHKDEVELEVPAEAEKFAQSMRITNIGLWADGENIIVVDYMIDPEETDEILAVKFDNNLEIVDISWES